MSTIQDVAKKANVSPTTVSHVINGTRYVSEDARARVQAAMDELGYHPNSLARSLRRGQTHTIGLVLPDSANPFFAEIGRAIEDTTFELGYSVILCNTEGDLDKEHLYIDVLSKKQVDGMVFVAAGDQTDSLQTLLRWKIPIVVVDRDLVAADVDAVLTDNRHGGYLATQHLIELGHRHIACITGPSNVTPSADRVIGYQMALGEADLELDENLIERGDFHAGSGLNATLRLFDRSRQPTAIFVCNDMMAVGALRAAAETGRRVPEDVAIVGFDDIELASYTTPRLTTVAQPKVDMGRRAVKLLIERFADKMLAPRKEVLLPQLIVRESSQIHTRQP